MLSKCPQCHQGQIIDSLVIELTNDAWWDDNVLILYKCNQCFVCIVAISQEERRGSLGDETTDYTVYLVSPAYFLDLESKISKCPTPRKADCTCRVHKDLGKLDAEGGELIITSKLPHYATLSHRFDSSTLQRLPFEILELDVKKIPWTEIELQWEKPNDKNTFAKITLFDKNFEIQMGDFPEESLYGIYFEGEKILSFDDWPDNYKAHPK